MATQVMYVGGHTEARSRNHCRRERQRVLCIMSVFVCVSVHLPKLSGMQTASFMHLITLSSVASLAIPCFPRYLINGTSSEESYLK
jgi:hypothetical protein